MTDVVQSTGATDYDAIRLKTYFIDYDYHVKHMVALSKKIKEEAPAYWKAKGYTVIPRLERLRDELGL